MIPSVRTIHGGYLQSCQLLGLPFSIKANTTLNEKFQIHTDVNLGETDMPRLRYIAIGNGGHAFSTGADGIPTLDPIQHRPKSGSLYNHLPFILRPLDADLTAVERRNYRLRRIETINNIRYAAYYLRVLDMSQTSPQMELREVTDGVISTVPYVPTISDLNPVAPPLTPNGVMTTTGSYIATTAKVQYVMTQWEVEELLAACVIKYGSDKYAIISELALCSGIDRTVAGEFNGASTGYVDAVAVQCCSFMNVGYIAKFSNSGLDIVLDVGSVEPLLF